MRALPELLLGQIHAALGDKLLGFYLVGSLVTGDFDAASSDVDLIAVLTSELTDDEVQRLDDLHADLIRMRPNLEDRIEVIYIAAARLKGDVQDYTIAEISPGEPFHVKLIHHDEWTVNWHVLREQGITLFGVDPKTLVDPIPHAKIVRVVRDLCQQPPDWTTPTHLPGQGYWILTLCRSLRLIRTDEFVSKKQAAHWAAEQFPEWAWLIEKPLAWRVVGSEPDDDALALYPQIQRLDAFLLDQVNRS